MAITNSCATRREMPRTNNESKYIHGNSPGDRVYRQTMTDSKSRTANPPNYWTCSVLIPLCHCFVASPNTISSLGEEIKKSVPNYYWRDGWAKKTIFQQHSLLFPSKLYHLFINIKVLFKVFFVSHFPIRRYCASLLDSFNRYRALLSFFMPLWDLYIPKIYSWAHLYPSY